MAASGRVTSTFRLSLALRRQFSSSSRAASFNLVKHADEHGIHKIHLDSPKTRNALSLEMLRELSAAFEQVNAASDARCVLLSAEGSVFSAGHNLKELTRSQPRDHHELVFSTCTALMKLMVDCPVPIVAKVDGIAAAAGCQVVAMSDIVLASSRSTFSTPGVSLGLFCSTPGVAVARSVPLKTASYMLYTGLPVTADEALRAGLVSRVVPHEQLESETVRVIDSIGAKSRPVIRLGKDFLLKQVQMSDIVAAFTCGEKVMVDNLQLNDAREGLDSFVEKRKPHFRDE